MGQYGHNNQPCHHILFLFGLLGDRASTETFVRMILDRAYGVDFYAGDEDNGEQGAWFVLAAMGVFPVAPGANSDYVLASPLFKFVTIGVTTMGASNDSSDVRMVSGFQLRTPAAHYPEISIVALGTSATAVRVSSVHLNKQIITAPIVNHSQFTQPGAVLRFVMAGETDAPPLSQLVLEEQIGASPSELRQAVEEKRAEIAALTDQLTKMKAAVSKASVTQHQQHQHLSLRQEISGAMSEVRNISGEMLAELQFLPQLQREYTSTPTWRAHTTGVGVFTAILLMILILRVVLGRVVRDCTCWLWVSHMAALVPIKSPPYVLTPKVKPHTV